MTAHGGVGGAIVESLLVVGIAAVFVAIWLRERRSRRDADEGPTRGGRDPEGSSRESLPVGPDDEDVERAAKRERGG